MLKKLAKFKFGGSVLHHDEHCAPVYHGVLPSSLEKAVTSQIYMKDNWQCASAELGKCTARVEGCQAGPRVLLHTLHHYALRPKIILVDFNLAVLTPTIKMPNLIPHQIFWLYGMLHS